MPLSVQPMHSAQTLVHIFLSQRDAHVIAGELVAQSRAFYYEPMPDDLAWLVVDNEHADYIFRRIEQLP